MSRATTGKYSITAAGIEASSPSLGSAISKALTLASRLQLSGSLEEGEVRSIYVRPIGGETAARVDVRKDLIQAFAY